MRTLNEIIEAVKSNKETTHEECSYALLVMEILWSFDSRSIRRMDENTFKSGMLDFIKKESFRRAKTALDKDPQQYLGWNYDPKNPQYQEEREMGIKMMEIILKKEK